MCMQETVINPKLIEWFDEYGDLLFRYAMARVHDVSTAEDMVQETILAAIASIGKYESGSSPRTWLTAIIKHKIIDHYRRSVRLVANDDDLQDDEFFDHAGHWHGDAAPTEWNVSPERVAESRELGEIISHSLRAIKPHLAAVFTLHEVDGYSADEICKILSLTPGNYWVMLHRARLRLRHEVELILDRRSLRPVMRGNGQKAVAT